MAESVKELTAAIASGDTEVFSRFYRERFSAMYSTVRRATGRDEAFCLDVIQDAMMRTIRAIPILDSEPALRAWLRRTLISCAIDRLRSESRHQRAELQQNRAAANSQSGVGNRERLDWLERELAALDRESSHLLVMRHRFGWTLSRIARELGLSTGAVDGRLGRLVRHLQRRAKESRL